MSASSHLSRAESYFSQYEEVNESLPHRTGGGLVLVIQTGKKFLFNANR